MLPLIATKLSILYIEDDYSIRKNAVEYLERLFHRVYQASNGEEGLEHYYKYKPSIIIADIEMPKLNGLDFIIKVRKTDKNIPIIITTAHKSSDYLLTAVELNLIKYIVKPFNLHMIEEALIQACSSLYDRKDIIFLDDNTYYHLEDSMLIRKDTPVNLGYKEKLLLDILIKNHKRIVPYEEIENILWEDEQSHKESLRTLVKRLRDKVGLDIKSYSKYGYQCYIS